MKRRNFRATLAAVFGRRRRVRGKSSLGKPEGRHIETLEQRRVLAVDFVSAALVDGEPFFTAESSQNAIPMAGTLYESPQQLIVRFTPGTEIDPQSLDGIDIVRSGGRLDGFGDAGAREDVRIQPGVLVVDDVPTRNQVVIRFAEPLPDDVYRFTISSNVDPSTGEISGLRTIDGQAFRGGGSFSFDVQVRLGPQVVAVVPQPISRDPNNLVADLVQARDTIDVYFNAAESLNQAAAESIEFYKLIEIDDTSGDDLDGSTRYPLRVMYDSSVHKAILEFATGEIADAKLYRLEVGGSGILVDSQVIPGIVGDAGSSFDTALAAGVIDEAGVTVSASIDPEGSVAMPGSLPDLQYPTQPGTIDEPGHRDIPIDFTNHGLDELGYETVAPPSTEIFTVPFNFQTHYGDDPQGNTLSNLITAEQKLRVREVFDLFSRYSGARFVETATEGITVALGDTRVISDNSPEASLEGLWRGSVIDGVPTADALAVINANRNWGESEYGGAFFRSAMRQIGKVLGLWQSYDVPSLMGDSLTGENVFPSDYDLIHLQQLYPQVGTDIDLYNFSLAEPGTLTAETIAGRLPAGASTLDTVLSVFSESYETTARVAGPVATVVGESAVVQGATATVGVSTTISAVGAVIAGIDGTVEGTELTVDGAETKVAGETDTVVGVASEVTGVEASVQGVAAQAVGTRATISAIAAQVVEAVSASTTVVLDDVSAISLGVAVIGRTGIPAGTTVTAINSLANSVVLSNAVTVTIDTFLGFELSGAAPVAARRFLVSDATAAAVGVPVNRVSSLNGTEVFSNDPDVIPAGTQVTGVDLDSGAVSFSTPITVAAGDQLGFGSTTAQLALDDVAAIPVGASLGLRTGDLAVDGQRPRVVAVNKSLGIVTLSVPHQVEAGELVAFDHNPLPELSSPVTARRFYFDNLDDEIVAGLLVSGVPGIPAGTTVETIDRSDRDNDGNDDEFLITFSSPVALTVASTVGFGFNGNTIRVADASAVVAGSTVEGLGVSGNTRVSSVDMSTGEIQLSAAVNIPDGINLGFSLPATESVDTNRLVVSQGSRRITVGAPLSDASGNPLGVSVARVDGRVVTLDGTFSVAAADEVFFGISGRTLYVADTTGVSVGRPLTAAGVGPGIVVSSVDHATGRVMLSDDITLTHDAAIQFGFFGTQVNVEDASGVVVGAAVGIDAGVTVRKVEGNTLTLSKLVSVADGSLLTVGSVGSVIKLTDASDVLEGVLVTGSGVPLGTRVAVGGINQVAGTVTLDTVVNVAAGATLGFGSDLTTIKLNTSIYDGGLAGASVSVNGVASGRTVSSISGTTATLSGTLDVADGDRLAFAFGGALSTDQIVVADANDITVGSELAGFGVTVTDVDRPSGLVRLSGNVSVNSGDPITFGCSGDEIVLDDASAVVVGAPLTGFGIPTDTFVTGVNGNKVTLSQSVTVAPGASVDIGFYGESIELDDATGVSDGVLINGSEGIRPNTSVDSGGVVGNTVTLTQPVRVTSGQAVGFGFTGTTVFGIGSTTVTVSDLTGVVVGSTVSGLPGAADGTITVAAISPDDSNDLSKGGTITLSSDVSVPDGLELRFGAYATATLTVDDASPVNVGDDVFGLGIPAGVFVVAVDESANELTLSQSVTVGADAILGFGAPTRDLIARNDNAFGLDSYLKIELEAGNYFVAVTSVGNTNFDPTIQQSGSGGRTEGKYDLSLKFKPAASFATTVVDESGTPLDGDRDGRVGGAFNYWFRTAAAAETIYVDKLSFDAATLATASADQATTLAVKSTAGFVQGMGVVGAGIPAGTTVDDVDVMAHKLTLSNAVTIDAHETIYAAPAGNGSLSDPYRTIAEAVATAAADPSKTIIRVLGNSGDELSGLRIAGTSRSLRPNAFAAEIDPHHYYVGLDEAGNPLTDGASLIVPAGVTLMVDAGAVLRMRKANIDVGSSSELVSRAEAALQVLGVPNNPVRLTSAVQGAAAGEQVAGPIPEGGDWGGIVLRADSDWQPSSSLAIDTLRPFLNTVNHTVIEYAGGEVAVDSEVSAFSAIQLEDARPTLAFNQILRSANAAIAATPNSFLEAGGRAGPQLSGNTLKFNTTDGLFVAIRTEFGVPIDTLEVAARFSSTEVTYVLQESLIISGGQGSYYKDAAGTVRARSAGRLTVDPGVVVKLQNARIELERGAAQLIAEGHPTKRVVFTNFGDYRFGAGGTFNTNGNLPDGYGPGRWGGIILNAGSQASIDNAFISGGGGEVPIEGALDQFNVIEVHQGDLRLANSRLQSNSDGVALTDRTARGSNEAATIFVRGAQPVIVGNDFRDNAGATVSINANSMNDRYLADTGRQSGLISRIDAYDDNIGPLIRDNRISYATTEPIVVGYDEPALPSPAEFPADGSVQQIDWNGQRVDVLTNSWVVRASANNAGPISFATGWSAVAIGNGFYEVTAPGASVSDVVGWATSNATVAYAEPNFLLRNQRLASDPQFDELWGLNNTGQNGGLADADIDAPEAWDITTGSNEVVIAVIDSGVDYTHEDLAANIWVNPGEIPGDGIDNDGNGFIDDIRGWDFGDGDADPMDDTPGAGGHGTHVAGTIGAVANNGVGVVGVSWDVRLMPLKIGDSQGGISTTAAIGAINYATVMRQAGVNIVASNNSWGGYAFSAGLRDAIEAGGQAGVLFVAAAANDSINNDQTPAYPASYDSTAIISVAATNRTNGLAGFSNFGATTVDVGAPGVDILSTLPGNAYGTMSGTSMASPHVAGVAALLAAANPAATMAEIRDAILNGAVPIPSLTNNVATGASLNAAGALAAFSGVSRTAGVVIRGEEITVNSVWDDTDIVHVLEDEIIVNNLHTATSLKILSKADASLVVKLAGADAGFTASGELLDIDDRVGGTVQVIGRPGFPVVLTSLYDDSVGASLDAYGFPVTDTNVDGTVSEPGPGDWRSLQFLPLSNDRNVSVAYELELPFTTGNTDENGSVEGAEFLGTLAPNYASDGDTWESAQEKSGDENRRLGFDVSGTIAVSDPSDVDVYSFDGYAGSEVWVDIDQTSSTLDTMLEVLDASGRVIARSANAEADFGRVKDAQFLADSGGVSTVAGPERVVLGSATAVSGVAAVVNGVQANITATAVKPIGFLTTISGVATRVEGDVTAETEIVVDDLSVVRLGSVFQNPTSVDVVVTDIDVPTKTIKLNKAVTFSDNDWIVFDVAGSSDINARYVRFDSLGNEAVNGVDRLPDDDVWLRDPASGLMVRGVGDGSGLYEVRDSAGITQIAVSPVVVQGDAINETFAASSNGYEPIQNPVAPTQGVLLDVDGSFYRLSDGVSQPQPGALRFEQGLKMTPRGVLEGELKFRIDQSSRVGSINHGGFYVILQEQIDGAAAPWTPSPDSAGAPEYRSGANQLVIHLDAELTPDGGEASRDHISYSWDGQGEPGQQFALAAPAEWRSADFHTLRLSVTPTGENTADLRIEVDLGGELIVHSGSLDGINLNATYELLVGADDTVDFLNPPDNDGADFPVDVRDINFQVRAANGSSQQIGVGLGGTDIAATTFIVDDLGVLQNGTSVTVFGSGGPPTLVNAVSQGGKTMTFGDNVNVNNNDFFRAEIDLAAPLTRTSLLIVDAPLSQNALLSGNSGFDDPQGTRVADVPAFTGAESIIELDAVNGMAFDPSELSLNAGFGGTEFIVEDSDALVLGMLLEQYDAANGIAPRGEVVAIDRNTDTVTLSSSVSVGDKERLRFLFDPNVTSQRTTRQVTVGSDVAVSGATVFGFGAANVPADTTVDSFDPMTKTVTLSGPIDIGPNDLIGFAPNANVTSFPFTSNLLVVDDGVDGLTLQAGTLVTRQNAAAGGLPPGTTLSNSTVATNSSFGNIIELSDLVSLETGTAERLGFGYAGTSVRLADVSGLTPGVVVAGAGVPAGTAIAVGGVDPVASTISLDQAINVEDGTRLRFSAQQFSLLAGVGDAVSILPGTLSGIIYDGDTAIQTFQALRDGSLLFNPVGTPPSRAIAGTIDYVTGHLGLSFDIPPRLAVSLEADFDYSTVSLTTLGFESGTGSFGAFPLTKDAANGGDFYTTNPRDAGMRLTLPGTQGTKQKYFIRVRSQPEVGADQDAYEANLVQASPLASGQTSGRYELSLRLRQRDEAPGSTVRFADIRYPVTGIDVVGLPNNSPLVGTTGEHISDQNDTRASAQSLGNLLTSDRNTVSVAGTISDEADVDWYTFTLSYEDIQSLFDHNDADKTWATVFDIDYADGFRGDLTLSVFNAAGQLIYIGRDSDIADDQPGPGQAGGDVDDLSRGSVGKLDPFIGSVQLPAGSETPQTYYVAVSSNERLPSTLDQTFIANATNPLARLEPISSLDRIAEDHIGHTGYASNGEWIDAAGLINLGSPFTANGDLPLSANVRPFTLADVTLFVSTSGSLFTIDPFTGQRETTIANYSGNSMADLDMLTNGTLVTYINYGGGADLGTLQTVNPADGTRSDSAFGGDGIKDDASGDPPPADNVWAISGSTPDAVAIRRTGVANYTVGGNFGAGSSPIVYSVRDSAGFPVGTRSFIYGADNSGDASMSTADTQAHLRGRMGYIPTGIDLDTLFPANNNNGTTITGFTTGLQYRNENGALYGVSQGGQFYRITQRDARNIPTVYNTELVISDARDFSGLLGGSQLAGLATAPVNLEGGRYQGMFFAVTTAGELICIDPDGNGLGDAAIVDNIFDTDGDGIADSHISTGTSGGVTGLAFSPLDTNLWHPTNRRGTDNGHGVEAAPDNTRSGSTTGSTSMRFGLEEFGVPNTYTTYAGQSGQYGVVDVNWQRDLTAGTDDANFGLIGNNYNLPGGAHGSLQTNSFSLVGYTATDKPTLYFNYFLETEGQDSTSAMRDSARVVASRDGGITWELLATNNSIRSGEDGASPRAELPPVLSASSQIGNSLQDGDTGPRLQHVQELFDSTGSWRQARVDLGDFAGESSVLLRFDFSTAGELDPNDNATIESKAERSVAVGATLDPLSGHYDVVLDSVAGLQVGMLAVRTATTNEQTLAVSGGVVETPEGPATIMAIDAVTGTVTLAADDPAVGVTFVAGEQISFFAAGVGKNNILGIASSVGDWTGNSGARSANNEFEGFYVDDITIGFAERGEMVTYDGGTTTSTAFFDIGTPADTVDYPQQTLTGEYQLEIRRGTEFADMPFQTAGMDWHNDSTTRIIQRFDTNDRLIESEGSAALVLQTASFANADIGNLNPIEVTGRGNGMVTPDPLGVGDDGTVALRADPSLTTTSHTVADWGVDLQGQPEAVLRYTLDMFNAGIGAFVPSNNEMFTPLPTTFTYIPGDSVNGGLPSGDGIAVDLDGTGNWITVDQFGVFGNSGIASFFGTANGSQGERWIDLVAKIQATDATIIPDPVTGSIFTADTRVAFFHTGRRSDGDGTPGGYNGGVVLSEVEILTSRPVETTGTIGDANNVHEFEQGQFVIQSNFVTAAASYGVRIDASRNGSDDPFGNYIGVTNEPDLGVARNLPVLNNSRLVPGAVVSNNVISGAGVAGVVFSGVTNSDVQPQSVVPYGRIVNNTIYGGADSATVGIDVNENAGPIILNNVFAELATGVQVDGSSQFDAEGNRRTVIATSAFHAVGVEVSGADQNGGITLTRSPFINASDGNFYPTTGTAIVDSSLSSLQDRNEYRVVTEPVGIASSPIVAPIRDIYGQLRVDDPQQANEPGLGGTVFQDRGAIERADHSQPFGRIVLPLDQGNSPVDTDGSIDSVVIEGPEARGIRTIAIQLEDVGVGIDKGTVTSDAFVVTRNDSQTEELGLGPVRLLDGIDYTWVYNENTNQVLFRAISVFPLGEYLVEVDSIPADQVAGVRGRVTDRANNPLRINAAGNRTTFFVALADVPGVVQGVTAVPEDSRAIISWTPQKSLAATLVTGYRVQWQEDTGVALEWDPVLNPSVNVQSVAASQSSLPISGLDNYRRYAFRVAAENRIGLGGYGDPVRAVPRGVIAAPQNVLGVSGNQEVTLTWVAPTADAQNPITGYVIEKSVNGGIDWAPVVDSDGFAIDPTALIGNLQRGPLVIFRVAGVTAVTLSGEEVQGSFGLSPAIDVLSVPEQVAGVTVTPQTNGTLLHSWAAPADGGQPLMGYDVEYSLTDPAGVPTWTAYPHTGSSPQVVFNGATAPSLVPGMIFWSRVRAENSLGFGDWSVAVESRMPTVPAGSLTVSVTGQAALSVAWDYTPHRLTELPVLDYLVEYQPVNSATWTSHGFHLSSPTPVPDLVIGQEYTFRVTPRNSLGLGAGETVNEMPTSVPDAPTALTADGGDRSVGLAWQPPVNSGGIPILEYEMQYRVAGTATWQPAGRTTGISGRVTSLVNGLAYEFRVAAVNAVGLGGFSSVAGPETIGLLLPPNGISAVPADGRIDLSWEAVNEGGLPPLTEYVVEYKATTVSTWTRLNEDVANDLVATISDLENAKSYHVRIASKNASGQGKFSSILTVEPFRLPGAVTDLTLAADLGQVTLHWKAPAETGGVPVEGYVVEYKPAIGGNWILSGESPATTATVNSLVTGQQYMFRVAAKTRFGFSDYLASSVITVGTPPATPSRILAWKETDGGVIVGWNPPVSPPGVVVSGYRVEYRRVGTQQWTLGGITTDDSFFFTEERLARGVSFEFRVATDASTGISAYGVSNSVAY